MKISKFVHSCLLVEDQGKTVLIDPGSYSVEEKALNIQTLPPLDYLLITDEHFDHMHIPTVKELAQKFPDMKIISTKSVKEILGKEGIDVSIENDENIQITQSKHEQVFGMTQMAENVCFTVFNKLTHPGDSFSFTQTSEILALPLQAPWGHLTQAVELATQLKPKIIIPIHDWHWKDEAREGFYSRLKQYFSGLNIQFTTTLGY